MPEPPAREPRADAHISDVGADRGMARPPAFHVPRVPRGILRRAWHVHAQAGKARTPRLQPSGAPATDVPRERPHPRLGAHRDALRQRRELGTRNIPQRAGLHLHPLWRGSRDRGVEQLLGGLAPERVSSATVKGSAPRVSPPRGRTLIRVSPRGRSRGFRGRVSMVEAPPRVTHHSRAGMDYT